MDQYVVYKMMELIRQSSKKEKNEENLRAFWDNIKQNDIHFIEVPEEEKVERKSQKIYLKKKWWLKMALT